MAMYLKALFEDLAGYSDHCSEHGSYSTCKGLHLHKEKSASASIKCREQTQARQQ